MFQGRTLLIATNHKKEAVIAPLFEKEFGVKCIVSKTFNTDTFGTFTGEIVREDDPRTTLKKKALAAMKHEKCDLVIASEGSFGQHPQFPIIAGDDELIILIDKKNNLEIIARVLTTETNYYSATIHNEQELNNYLDVVNFPSHGVILKSAQNSTENLIKGIIDRDALITQFNLFIEQNESVYLETDMRAMFNPTRMKIIEKAAHKLVEKIKSICPECNTPGFEITKTTKGLPCSNCNLQTQSILSSEHSCSKCEFTTEIMFPHSIKTEDPTFCDFCNP